MWAQTYFHQHQQSSHLLFPIFFPRYDLPTVAFATLLQMPVGHTYIFFLLVYKRLPISVLQRLCTYAAEVYICLKQLIIILKHSTS